MWDMRFLRLNNFLKFTQKVTRIAESPAKPKFAADPFLGN